MSTVKFPMAAPELTVVTVPTLSEIILNDDFRIPAGITDLQTFWEWAESDEFPAAGRVAYLSGEIWADLSMEQIYTHLWIKQQLNEILGPLARSLGGMWVPDGARLNSTDADLCTDPDGLFVTFRAIQEGRVRQVTGSRSGYTAFEGAPEMVAEIVSDSSVAKDNERLPDLYFRAGVTEFWRIDARGDDLTFEILRRADTRYVPSEESEGWWFSSVFGRWFRFVRESTPLGEPVFTLEHRE